jgi:GPI-anchor transamidase subunit K
MHLNLVIFLLLLCSACFGNSEEFDTWAVIVCTSRYWFNYRHMANALAIYKRVKQNGVPDNRIILMSSLEAQNDPRNPYPGKIFSTNNIEKMNLNITNNNEFRDSHLFSTLSSTKAKADDDDVQIDYGGNDCNTENFLRLLSNRHEIGTPLNQQLLSGPNSKILIYLTGHGGDSFLKFHDQQELSSSDLSTVFNDMYIKKRYKEILLIIDTCQASTLFNGIKSISIPNISYISSSNLNENSYAYDTNHMLGLAVIDRFTYKLTEYLSKIKIKNNNNSNKNKVTAANSKDSSTVNDLMKYLRKHETRAFMYSTATFMQTKGSTPPNLMKISDFFGNSGNSGNNNDDNNNGVEYMNMKKVIVNRKYKHTGEEENWLGKFPSFDQWKTLYAQV